MVQSSLPKARLSLIFGRVFLPAACPEGSHAAVFMDK
jgi:hypothetical protein